MNKEARLKFNQYKQRIAELNNVDNESLQSFTVEPSVAQTLESKIQENSSFLQCINIVPVDQQKGETIGLGVSSPIAGRTDTTQGERKPTDPTSLSGKGYECAQTNFDTVIRYARIDMYAKFADFQQRIRDAILKRQSLDRIMIGFHGIKREKTTDKGKYPLLEDVNIGWLQKIRDEAPEKVFSKIIGDDGQVASETVKIGKNEEYKNIDALVMNVVDELIDPWFQDDTELVVICGRKLLSDKYFDVVNQDQPNSEKISADLIISQKKIGNLPAVRVPFFPAKSMLITRLDNLSIYIQEGTRRRSIIDNPKRDQIENYESVNEDYVVEDLGCVALIENIEITN